MANVPTAGIELPEGLSQKLAFGGSMADGGILGKIKKSLLMIRGFHAFYINKKSSYRRIFYQQTCRTYLNESILFFNKLTISLL